MEQPHDIERQERIEAYVNGKLTNAERLVFEGELANDKQLRADVEVERVLRGALEYGPEVRFRELVERVSAEQEKTAGRTDETPVISIDRKRNWSWIAAAASVALIATLAIAKWMGAETAPELAMNYATTSLTTDRSGGDAKPYSGVMELDSALNLILVKKPDQAKALLDAYIPSSDQLACKRNWLIALAFLQLEQEAEAIELLDNVIRAQCYPEEIYATEVKEKL